ncbi:heme biosynthesis protein HemY [Magnetovibrio sp.]|uniref:heme biosynthesis protein HemY n=1 Tax=Magnetovibrio sp. TaxID=2024836 RepID=UPI002F93B0B7
MLRLILFLIAVGTLAWGVIWVGDNPGQVSLNWHGWQVETSAGVLAGGVALFTITVALTYRFWLFLTRAPGQITASYRERRSRKGYKALTKGMVAVAAGDAEESRRQVQKADGLLGEPPLTLLLKAQSAQLNGDELAAERFFTAMLDDPEMEFLGLRGLLNQAVKRGDDVTALELARRAQALKPKSEWLAEALFDLEARAGTWLAASDALNHMTKLASASKGENRHRQAVVAFGESLDAEKTGDPVKALKYAEKAVSLDSAFTAAAVRLADMYLSRGNTRKAQGVVEKAWGLTPHPDLVALYFRARKVANGLSKVSALEKLLSFKPGAVEGHIAIAEAALEAKLWGQARTHLGAAMEAGRLTRKVFTLMAELEDQDRSDKDQVRHWLARAATAAADPLWVCTNCGHVTQEWSTHCPKCRTFDPMVWDTPPGLAALPAQQTHLALLSADTPSQD